MAITNCAGGDIIGAGGRLLLYPLEDKGFIDKGIPINGIPVRGLNTWQLPGMSREMITRSDLESDFDGQIAGGGTYSSLTFGGAVRKGDTAHNILQGWLTANLDLSGDKLWFYTDRNAGDFWAMDLARDPCGKMNIGSYAYQDTAKNALMSFTGSIAIDGPNRIFDVHTDDVTYAIAAGVLTATDGNFITAGFKSGMSVIAETGVSSERAVYGVINAVTATTITFEEATLVLASGEGKIHGSSASIPVVA